MLPHELLPHLVKHGHVLPNKQEIGDYWSHMFRHASWGPGHPLNQAGQRCAHLPLFLYADDVKWTNEEKLTQVCVGQVLESRRSSMETHWPLFLIRQACSRIRNPSLHLSAQKCQIPNKTIHQPESPINLHPRPDVHV